MKQFQHLDQCVFCNKSFVHQQLLNSHAASCEVIQRLEKRRACRHCHWEAAESTCIAHEAICAKNTGNKSSTKEGLTCANCGIFHYNRLKKSRIFLKKHLVSGCLPFLKACTEKSMKTCELNRNADAALVKTKSESKMFRIKNDLKELARSQLKYQLDCLYCSLSFNTFQHLLRHLLRCKGLATRGEHRECRFNCTTCPQPEVNIAIHEATCEKAPKVDRFRCFNCNKLLKGKLALETHVVNCLDFFLDYAQEVIDHQKALEDFKQRVLNFAIETHST